MTDARPPAEALFLAAADADAPTRAALLDAAPPEVRAEAEALLRADAEADGFFARPRGLTRIPEAVFAPESDLAPGTLIGPYQIEAAVGHGGMGAVYRAARADGLFKQTVALKMVHRGVASPDLLRRAADERHALARLRHPGVARLLDAGTAPDGRPYLAMEFVDGAPLLDYAETGGLGVADRIALFLQVCDAVAAAHRALVVHRDLKPSNVVVAEGEGGPRVILLDFGIAKVLDGSGDPTRSCVRAFTPAYAAPEQRAGGPLTTAVDVWALGALLFELLTGRRASGSHDETRTRPSDAAETAGAPALARRLRGDLDAIVQKALREEPEARYPTAAALSDDLRRHLEGQPVRARSGTTAYLAGRFVRRHRQGVAAGAFLAVAVATFLALLLAERSRTREALAEAEATARFLEALFFENDVGDGHGGDYTVRQALDEGVRRVGLLADEPHVHGRMLDVLGRTYRALLDFDRADSLLTEAVRVRTLAFGPEDPRTLASTHHLGYLREAQGREEEALALYTRVLEERRRHLSEEPQAVVESAGEIAGLLVRMGRPADARSAVREGQAALRLAVERGFHGDPRFHQGHLAQTLGLAALAEGDLSDAERAVRDARSLYVAGLGTPDHVYVAFIERALAHILADQGRLAEADPILAHAEGILIRDLPPEHPGVQSALLERSRLALGLHDPERAEALARGVVEDPADDRLAMISGLHLGLALEAQGQTETARRVLGSVLDKARRLPAASDDRRHVEAAARALGLGSPSPL